MIGAVGQNTADSGMWTTYPARPIEGVMVSEYLPYGRERSVPLAQFLGPGADVASQRYGRAQRVGHFLVRSHLHEAGAVIDSIELLDICPTFLSLLDLPPARDMPGAILSQGLTEAGRRHVKQLEKHRVPSYMELCPVEGAEAGLDPAVGEEIRKQLRSLGYIN